jgi:hypothetical protein
MNQTTMSDQNPPSSTVLPATITSTGKPGCRSQTVASATEELSASVAEIERQVSAFTRVANDAVGQAQYSSATMLGLSEAAQRIGEVVKPFRQSQNKRLIFQRLAYPSGAASLTPLASARWRLPAHTHDGAFAGDAQLNLGSLFVVAART